MQQSVLIFEYGSDDPLSTRVEYVHTVSVSDDDLEKLKTLIDHPSTTAGRSVLTSIVDAVLSKRCGLNTCALCHENVSVTSYHRTKMRRYKDGRICIENRPIYLCRSLGCMEKAEKMEQALKQFYACRVIDDTSCEKEVRKCVACKQFLHRSMFDDENWCHFGRRCKRCDRRNSHRRRALLAENV